MAAESIGTMNRRLGRKYKQYMEDIITYEISTQQNFSVHNAMIFFIFGIVFLLLDVFLWKEYNAGTVLCLVVSVLSTANCVLYRTFLPKHKSLVIPAGNIYVTIMIMLLLSLDQMGEGAVSWTLLLCSLISTSMVIIIPSHYIFVILLALGMDMVEYMIINAGNTVGILYNLVDDVIIGAFCIGINLIFSQMKYEELKSKQNLYMENSQDALTGLYNRKYFKSYFEGHAYRYEKCAVLMFDLDNFKKANDVFGHKKGDEVLCKVADVLKSNFREGDCIARLGGDEFAVFLPEVFKSEVIIERVERVLKQFPIVIEGETNVEVSVSVGVVFKSAGDIPSYTKLCEKADAAMYQAKRTGKAHAVVTA
jgi:diguanylate cyclase (GGDEF)-like protein